jgi:hypothetical protein
MEKKFVEGQKGDNITPFDGIQSLVKKKRGKSMQM